MAFKEISAENLQDNVFKLIGKDWLLVTGTVDGKSNAMTASWGGMGVMWGKPVAFLVIRPQRYTKEFIDKADKLTISVLHDDGHRLMNYFGSVSGRTEDKIARAGLTPIELDGQVYFEQARTAMLCRKLYAQPMAEEYLLDKESNAKWYPNKDYHVMYIVELEKILVED